MAFGLVKHNNNSISAITSAGQLAQGKMTLIKEQTASSSSTVSFVDGSGGVVLDNTYPIYKFEFINVHPSTYSRFVFQADVNGGSSYNQTITSTKFNAYNQEHSGTNSGLEYQAGGDQAQGTDFHRLTNTIGYGAGYADNDQAVSGHLTVFNPSSTTFVKHFIATTSQFDAFFCYSIYSAGYFNTTSALDRFQFKFSSGTMDSGSIKLYGIKDS
jgi:hypothetical protein